MGRSEARCPAFPATTLFVISAILLYAAFQAYPLGAQQNGRGVSFEVASIRPSGNLTAQFASGGPVHIGMRIDGARVDLGGLSLADLIGLAYDLRPYQIIGPNWMQANRFDILANMPADSTKNQVPAMVQSLLAERFKLLFHREKREHAFYVLNIAKSGLKITQSPDVGAEPAQAGSVEGDSQSEARRNVRATAGPDGTIHVENRKMSLNQLAIFLSSLLDRPVIDATGLKGDYQVALAIPLSAMQGMTAAAGFVAPRIPALNSDPANPASLATDPSGDDEIFSSIHALGLNLVPRKIPIEVIVIDQLEKSPTEN